MLHDFVYLKSQPPSRTCRNMDGCSLSLYLGACASCEFSDCGDQSWEPVSLATAEQWLPAPRTTRRGHAPRSAGMVKLPVRERSSVRGNNPPGAGTNESPCTNPLCRQCKVDSDSDPSTLLSARPRSNREHSADIPDGSGREFTARLR
jgi:hypothetical protein